MQRATNGQANHHDPNTSNSSQKPLLLDPIYPHNGRHRLHRNGKHERSTPYIPQMQKPRLNPTRNRRRKNAIKIQPMKANNQRQTLKQVCKQQIEDQDGALIRVYMRRGDFPP